MPRGSDMDKLLRGLDAAPERLMDSAATATASALRASADAGYRTRRDVHGKAYALPKDGHRPPMQRTGTLRRDYGTEIQAAGADRKVTLRTDTDAKTGRAYDEYLRDGTAKMEPRQHIPKPGEAMPASWDARAKRDQDAAVQKEGRRVWPA